MSKKQTNEIGKYLNTLTFDLEGKDYHATPNTFSSSQLKDMLKDPEYFHKKYITKEIEKDTGAHFDVGTYFHTSVLEPQNLDKECVVYVGAARRGAGWEAFKEDNSNKTIITLKEKDTVDTLVAAIEASPICKSFLRDGKAEVSAFLELQVFGGEIFAFRGKAIYCLQTVGWVESDLGFEVEDIKKHSTKIVVKARADYISTERGYISDLKSTSGNTKSVHEMQSKVDSWGYDLSLAMYLDIFNFCSPKEITEFYWLFASKDIGNARAYKASEKNKMIGRNKWRKAILDLAFYLRNDWKFKDTLGEIGPAYYNLEWLEDDKCKAIEEEQELETITDEELL